MSNNQTQHKPVQPPKPADRLVFNGPSLLDTIYTSKLKKRPIWLTSTLGPVTNLFSISSSSGRLDLFAVIHWESTVDASTSGVRVEIKGEPLDTEQFGMRTTQGFLSKNTKSNVFHLGDLSCHWTLQDMEPGIQDTTVFLDAPIWTCYAHAVPSSPPTQSKWKNLLKFKFADQRQLLAIYRPTYSNVTSIENLAIYSEGAPHVGLLIVSLILLEVKKDAWKKFQSASPPTDLEAVLTQDATGNLPMYTPERGDDSNIRTDLHPTLPPTTPWRWTSPPSSRTNTAGSAPRLSRSASTVARELPTHS